MAIGLAVALASGILATTASGPAVAISGANERTVTSEVVASVVPEPYYYRSYETFYPTGVLPRITRATTKLHVELAPQFIKAEPETVTWTIGTDITGMAFVAATEDSVDIELPVDFFERAWAEDGAPSALPLIIDSVQHEASAGLPPSDFARYRVPSGLSAEITYFVRLSTALETPVGSPATVPVRLADYESPRTYPDERYWATIPGNAIVTADSVLRFESSSPLWDHPGLMPGVSTKAPDLLEPGQATPNRRFFDPQISADHTSLSLEAKQIADAIQPRLSTNGLLQIEVSMLPVADGGVRVTLNAPTGSASSVSGVSVTRLSGGDRYSGSVLDAYVAFPNRTSTVYLASGEVFSDALSAGAAAAARHSPLVLQAPGSPGLASYLSWLKPTEIVIVGGPTSVADADVRFLIEQARLDPAAVSVRRDAGVDRYEASRTISAKEFADGADTAFLATGATFADALTALPAAASVGAPVILVRGDQAALDAATRSELERLGVSKVVIAGGTASISAGIEQQLRTRYGSGVIRYGGASRFDVADAINSIYFPTASSVYLATGLNFPDALTGGIIAAVEGSPILLTRTDCLPKSSRDLTEAWKPSKVTLLGGVNSLGTGVQRLDQCR
jgi:putative cell wall-binding protein